MKNLFKSLMIVAVAAMAFAACSEVDEQVDVARRVATINFTADINEDDTRSGFTERVEETDEEGNTTVKYKSEWDGGENIAVVLTSQSESKRTQATIAEAGTSVSFSAEFEDPYEVGMIYAYSPAEAWVEGEYFSDGHMAAVIPTEQTPRANSVDPKAHLLYAQGPYYTNYEVPTEAVLTFWHQSSYGKMTINHDVKIESLKIQLVGTTPYTNEAYNKTFTLDAKNVENNVFWFACDGLNVSKFVVSAECADGITYRKAVTIPEGRKLEFRSGKVSAFSVSGLSDAPISNSVIKGAWYSNVEYHLSVFNEDSDLALDLALYCPTSVMKVVPEGTYPVVSYADFDEEGNYAETDNHYVMAAYSYAYANNGYGSSAVELKSGEVVVKHLDEGYHIVVEVVDNNGVAHSYEFAGIMNPSADWSSIGNPPIPWNEAEYDATLVSLTGAFYEGTTEGYYASGDRFDLTFTTADPAYTVNLSLEVPMGQDTYGIIPEGTFTFGAEEGLVIADGATSYPTDADTLSVTEGTLSVAYNATKNAYDFVLNVTNGLKTTIKVTATVERIATTTEWDVAILSPEDSVVTPLDTPDVVSVVEGNKIALTWDAVANADRYEVTANGEVKYSGKSAGYTLTDLDYDTEYTVTVVAYPAASAATLKESDPWTGYIRTAKKTTPDYEITLTGISSIEGNTIRFIGDNTADYMEIEFNPGLASIVAGSYEGVDVNPWTGTDYTNSSALEFNTYNETFFGFAQIPSEYPYYANADSYIDVAVFGSDYMFVANLYAYIDGGVKLVRYTYEGPITTGGGWSEEFDGTIQSWTYTNTSYPTYYAVKGNGFSMELGFYYNYKDYIAKRETGYTIGDSSWYARYFSVRNLVINGVGQNLTPTYGSLMVNEGGAAGAIHDIDIEFTINGTVYEFSYYGYINGEAIAGGNPDDDEPEVPTLEPLDITMTSMSEGESLGNYYAYDFANNSNSSFRLLMLNDVATNTAIQAGTYSVVQSTGFLGASNFMFVNGSLTLNGKAYSNEAITAGTATIAVSGENYTITIVATVVGKEFTLRYNGPLGTAPTPTPDPTPDPEPEPDVPSSFNPWTFTADLSADGLLTMVDDDGNTVTAQLGGRYGLGAGTYYINDTDGVFYATDITVNGKAATSVGGTIAVTANDYFVSLNMTVDGVKYTGTSTNNVR